MIVDVSKDRNVVGQLNFNEPINEISIESDKRSPNIKKIGVCSVEVYEKEGAIPHMHVIGKDFEACVCLHTNKYFSHNESKYSQFANAKHKQQFNEWLKRPNVKFAKNGMNMTNFQTAVYLWVKNRNAVYFDMSVQPDYDVMWEEIKDQ